MSLEVALEAEIVLTPGTPPELAEIVRLSAVVVGGCFGGSCEGADLAVEESVGSHVLLLIYRVSVGEEGEEDRKICDRERAFLQPINLKRGDENGGDEVGSIKQCLYVIFMRHCLRERSRHA